MYEMVCHMHDHMVYHMVYHMIYHVVCGTRRTIWFSIWYTMLCTILYTIQYGKTYGRPYCIPYRIPNGIPYGVPYGMPNGVLHGIPHGIPYGVLQTTACTPYLQATYDIYAWLHPTLEGFLMGSSYELVFLLGSSKSHLDFWILSCSYNSQLKTLGFSPRAAAPRPHRSGGRTGGRAGGTQLSDVSFVFDFSICLILSGGYRPWEVSLLFKREISSGMH